jgi:hypothetical protein
MITDGHAEWTMVQCPSVEDRGTVVVQGPLAAPTDAGLGQTRRAEGASGVRGHTRQAA